MTRVRIELRRFVQACGDPIMISPNRSGVQRPDTIDGLYGTGTISDDISATKDRVVARLPCALDASFKRLDVGVDVTEDEIAHGV
jgi:hypothetical protein